MLQSIFVCGKSLNLLRICDPAHFLFSNDVPAPTLAVTYLPEVCCSRRSHACIL